MSYEIYKRKATMEKYFSTWDSENYKKISDILKLQIYTKYLIKCEVFQRDNFICLNTECSTPDSLLTLHHVKFQKNGGKDSARNCVTLCNTCHKAYHRGKRRLVFPDSPELPTHISNKVFVLHSENSINWKKIKVEMRKFRKTLQHEHLYLTMEQVTFLMKFLEYNFMGEDD